MEQTIHQGKNVKRFRELFNMKQDTLAKSLGEDWNQQKISLLEAREAIDDKLLEQVASALHIPADAIRKFDEQAVINIIGNTANDQAAIFNFHPNFNPIEKIVELYERLLKSEQEKVEILTRQAGR